MDSSQIQETICDDRDIEPLYTLIKKLNKYFEGPACNILEITLLEEFPASETIHPIEGFSPRQIIENMMEKHKRTQNNIWENSDMLKTFVCKCKIGTKECEFVFSNNMEFYADVQIICYLYHKILRYNIQTRAVQKVMDLMVNKYEINSKINLDPRTITFSRVAHSYPSVTLDMFNYDFERYSIFLFLKFPEFDNIPRAMFSPVIPSILPWLKDPPIVILTAIFLKLDDVSKHDGVPKISLNDIFNRVFTTYISTIFPKRLKLKICKRWKIVVMEENEYKFARCLTACHQKAKNMISKLRPEDPDLEKILFKL